MDAAIMVVLLLLSLPRLCLRAFFFTIVFSLGSLISKILLFIALSFARIISAVLFLLILGPIWVIQRFFSYRSPRLYGTSIPTTNHSDPTPKKVGGNVAGRDGIPSDWVTVRLCRTDEISDFQLDNRTVVVAGTVHGIFDGWIGSWEKRELFVTTREEIDVKVMSWLKTLET